VSEQDRLYRVDLVACAPTRCTPAAPAFPRSHPSPVVWLASLHLVGARVGWAQRWTGNPTIDAPSHLVVTRTTDTGRTWSRVRSLDFVNPSHGWLLEDLGAAMGADAIDVFETVDGGERWRSVARTSPIDDPDGSRGTIPVSCDKAGLSFVTTNTGWITGACNGAGIFFFVTHDGGRRWAAQSLPLPPQPVPKVVVSYRRPSSSAASGF
jgi:photosystem II stability/assembly factor-like uncharacterized protein